MKPKGVYCESDVDAVVIGSHIPFFKLRRENPKPGINFDFQNWHEGVVKYISPCGRYAIVSARPSWGKRQEIKVKVDDLIRR